MTADTSEPMKFSLSPKPITNGLPFLAAINLLGEEKSNCDIEPRLFSEDFSIMSKVKPGCFILMGNGTIGANGRPLHAADYDFNDELLVVGSSYWTELAEQQLK